ncbi:MAG: RsmB/NOP family class I SAM-dependent RNA methyltransferase [Victivallales bacterium]|nr:RsmB/NOP family class I SAM-dependent RNA methyltransferase [Victivallales bacterium]
MKFVKTSHQKNNILETTLANVFNLLNDSNKQSSKPSDMTSSRIEQNILFTIKRHQASINWLIDKIATGKVRPRTRKVLWWALAELLFLDGAALHAVVDTATHFVKTHHALQEASFVNAILRRISDAIVTGTDVFAKAPEIIRLEMPSNLWDRWLSSMGAKQAREIAQTILSPSPIVFRYCSWPPSDKPLPKFLEPMEAPDWMPDAQLFTSSHTPDDLGKFMVENPQIYIQDPATLLAPAMLAPIPGETIADLCAAPGGKSRIIAESLHDTGILLCQDKSEDKIQRLKSNLVHFNCVRIQTGDATRPDIPPKSLDAVILDVPCTNTGVLRRKPDAKWSFDNAKLNELVDIQRNILEAALPLLKPKGRIVYSTCSLEPEENSLQIQAFLSRHPDVSLVKERQLFPEPTHDGAYSALMTI